MKWKTKKEIEKRDKNKKTVNRFALFPVKLDNGLTIWFEKYKELSKFQGNPIPSFNRVYPDWVVIKKYQDKR